MAHLSDSVAMDLAEGREDRQADAHAAACDRCGTLVARFRSLLDGLAATRRPLVEVPPQLLHWARTCTRSVVTASRRPSFLRLLALGAQPVAAVRGTSLVGTAALYGNDRYQVDLQVEPQPDGGHRLQGQIVPVTDTEERLWTVGVLTEDGHSHETTSDGDGEFSIPELSSWEGLLLIAQCDEDRLVVPRLGASCDGCDSGATEGP